MASVDQGASQRRGTQGAGTRVGQASTLSPKGSEGESYLTSSTSLVGQDIASSAARQRDQVTQIGLSTMEVSPNRGTSYRSQSAGSQFASDKPGADRRTKEPLQSSIGSSGQTQTSARGQYVGMDQAFPTPLTGGGSATVVTYKLRAQDSGFGPVTYVYWTSTTVSTASYPGTPVGALINLVIVARF